MIETIPYTREIVLVGGGHTHALILRRWGMAPLPGARLTVINPAATAPYTGMLPGFVAGHYARDDLEIDILRLARFAGARMIFGLVDGIDAQAKTVSMASRPPIPYHILSLDIGITSTMPDLPGFSEHGIAAKPLGPFATRWQAFLDQGAGPLVVIGGGVAGVELALAMRHRAGKPVTIVEQAALLSGVGASTRARLQAALRTSGISVIEGAEVTEITATSVRLANDATIPSDFTLGAAGARPYDWLKDTGLDLTDGYVTVGPTLQSKSDPSIFATGDCAHLSHAPRPKAGVFAVRAAPVLTHNLAAAAAGRPLKPFNPQSQYLKLISLGPKRAVADKWDRSVAGDWVWRWKDRIDRKFMHRLDTLPEMPRPETPEPAAEGVKDAMGDKPLCAGCGAKIGPDTLTRVLAKLPASTRKDVEIAAGDDAAILRMGRQKQVLTTDHLRAFWDDPYVFGRIAALHAMGDIWAMGAELQAALVEVTLPRMSAELQENWLTEVLAAAQDVFGQEGGEIVGGHSTIGAELVLGFTLTGLAKSPMPLSGAKPGDQLLLTRPIGSGTLLAAMMAGEASGPDIERLIGILATSQSEAAKALAAKANALTDVTGFGLAGHAERMAAASGLTAHLMLSRIPVLLGAEKLAARGTRSSIWDANRRATPGTFPESAISVLLFDPQTAGGLLATVPANQAEPLLAEVQALGHDAALIGEMRANTDGQSLSVG